MGKLASPSSSELTKEERAVPLNVLEVTDPTENQKQAVALLSMCAHTHTHTHVCLHTIRGISMLFSPSVGSRGSVGVLCGDTGGIYS